MTGARLTFEWWAPDFAAVDGDALEASEVDIEAGVETDPSNWAPLRPRESPARTAVFIDGVRRIDARMWATSGDGSTRQGLAASYAAGAVRCDGAATVVAAQVRRRLLSPAREVDTLRTRYGDYEPACAAGDDTETLSVELQRLMGALETQVALGVPDADLVVVDGPLNQLAASACVVGYVKTHRRRYLPDELAGIIARLEPGERTPLFATAGSWTRYCWYARLPGPAGHPWAGVVRGEAAGDLPVTTARRLADRATVTLPGYASTPQKDPRAPQNLFPVAGLERALRHRLGAPALVLRSLRARTS